MSSSSLPIVIPSSSSLLHASYLQVLSINLPPLILHLQVMATTAPWLVRHKFPVNSFSANYRKGPGAAVEEGEGTGAVEGVERSFIKLNEARLIRLMYRTKKIQYLAYKHALLHGLNISVAVSRWAYRNICLQTKYLTCGVWGISGDGSVFWRDGSRYREVCLDMA